MVRLASTKKLFAPVARLASSTFVLIAAGLLIFEGFVRIAQPLSVFDRAGLTTHNNRFVTKLPPILQSADNKNVLLVGASGVLFPNVRCDDKFHGIDVRCDKKFYGKHILSYSRADYLEHLLSQQVGNTVTVCNAAVAGSVVSDDYLVAKKYLASNKTPQMVIVFTAPRDFYDNTHTRLDQTFTYAMLADFTSIPELLLNANGDFVQVLSQSIGMMSSFYHQRADFKTLISQNASRITGHPETLFAANAAAGITPAAAPTTPATATTAETGGATKVVENQELTEEEIAARVKTKTLPPGKPNTLDDIAGYRDIYLPVNHAQFEKQSSYMEKLLTMLREKGMQVVLVDIPVTKENLALLPSEAQAVYQQRLLQLSTRYGATLVQPSVKRAFNTLSDFEDSAHMNESGGEKLFGSISDAIGQSAQLSGALRRDSSRALAQQRQPAVR